MQNYVQTGKTVDVELVAAADSGDVVIKGGLKGVASRSGAIADKVGVTQEGVFSFVKKAGVAFTQGDSVYWDGALKEATDDSAEPFLGVCVDDVLAGAVAVEATLNGAAVLGSVITNFNLLAAKLDLDTGVTDTDYAALLTV